jgi:hypothetical protein
MEPLRWFAMVLIGVLSSCPGIKSTSSQEVNLKSGSVAFCLNCCTLLYHQLPSNTSTERQSIKAELL